MIDWDLPIRTITAKTPVRVTDTDAKGRKLVDVNGYRTLYMPSGKTYSGLGQLLENYTP